MEAVTARDDRHSAALYAARLVGAFRLVGPDGLECSPRGRRARAMVAYLILTPPHAAARETLATLLWSERGEEQARASLRQALFELRSLVGGDRLLSVTRGEVRLTQAAITTDLEVLDRAAARGDLADLARAFGEPDATLLADMRDLDPVFDEWLAHRRLQWRDARRTMALDACRSDAAVRDPALALRIAQLVARADPLDETAAVAAMAAAHAGGDIATTRRIYATLKQSLQRDLGVAPSSTTTAAYERLTMTVGPAPPAAPSRLPPPSPSFSPLRGYRRAAIGLGTALAAVAAVAVLMIAPSTTTPPPGASPTAQPPLPIDPAAAALFLQARDDAAERDAGGLRKAVVELQRVTRLQPRFAPGYAALADAYLLAGEAGSLSPTVAFDGAEHAADQARALDPRLAAAHRAKGFILYWWKHRAAPAGVEFREAVRLDPSAAQTHFWYANVLADAGQQAPAVREFDRARLGDPGSEQIGADYAWALWVFGETDAARTRLNAILAAHPTDAEALDCAATIALADGSGARFLEYQRRRAEARGEPTLIARNLRLTNAYRRGGEAGMLRRWRLTS